MPKELLELLESIKNKKAEAKAFLDANKITEATAARDEAKALQAKFDVAKDIFEDERQNAANSQTEPTPAPGNKVDPMKEFANAAREGFKNTMTVGSPASGGYTVPSDIQTKINLLRESKDALQNYITVEKVSAPTGSRVFKARSQQTGFAVVDEGGNISEKDTPTFTQLVYAVLKYAGFFKVTNELLKDSDAAITNTLINWIGNESRVTRNKLILAVLGTKAKTAIATADALKKVLNVTLDPAFHPTASILTNQDGFNWLDTLKDGEGNYLLQPSATSPTGKQFAGKPVIMVSNKDLPTDITTPATPKAPIIIGDLKEAVVMFEREGTDIASSTEAGTAFTTDVTLWRAIEREVVKMRDAEAFVYGQVTIPV